MTRSRRSSVAGEDEYAFRHALVRDVAYEQIPRAARVDKHRTAAEWMESLGRPEDHAEMLAHHYASAIEYARATGRTSTCSRTEAGAHCGTRETARWPSMRFRPPRATTSSRSISGRTTTRVARDPARARSFVPPRRRRTSGRSPREGSRGRPRDGAAWSSRPRPTRCSPSSGGSAATVKHATGTSSAPTRRSRIFRPRPERHGCSARSRATGCWRVRTRMRFGSVRRRSRWPTSSGSWSPRWKRSSTSV